MRTLRALPRRVVVLGRYELPDVAHRAALQRSWPLNGLDAMLVAQTDAGRPMTRHLTLELDRPVALDRWARALSELVREYPELGSRVIPEAGARIVSTPPRAALLDRLIHERDGSHAALERWLAAPIDPAAELPIRVRVSPGQVAEQAVTLSLHHSLCDGVGAMQLFDRLTARAAGLELRPRASKPYARYTEALGPPLRELWGRLRELRRPAAQLVDRVESWSSGQQLALRVIGPSIWGPLGRLCRAAGVSRMTALWHAVASVTARARLDDASLPLRLLAGVDLRDHLGIPDDALGNWLGTLEHDSPSALAEPLSLAQLHAELCRAQRPERARLTPALLVGLVDRLPSGLVRRLFRRLDSELRPSPYSLVLGATRVPARQCWPLALQPRRLWTAETLGRRPGLALSFTQVGERVYVAASCPAATLRRATLERFLDDLLDVLVARIGAAQWGRVG